MNTPPPEETPPDPAENPSGEGGWTHEVIKPEGPRGHRAPDGSWYATPARPRDAAATTPAVGSNLGADASPLDLETAMPSTPHHSEPQSRGSSVDLGNLAPGQVVFGKYLVVQELGRGGMGTVWLVRHQGLDAERALKLIISNRAFDPQTRARFRREARAMARFSHPNAVAVHDADVRRDGEAAFIEMEYVRGQSLNKVLRPGVPMPLDWTARIAGQLCDVLHEAHEHGIVHRDLKPSNLMLVEGRPPGAEFLKVLDFGIAKILGAEDREPDDPGTLPGFPLGTPPYMSPEQVGAGLEGLDRRSDLYAVGVILYEALTGSRPFDGPVYKLIYDHLHTPPPPFAERNPEARVPPEIERLVLRCLEKDPALRPQTASELAEEFRRLTAPPPPPSPPPPPRRLRVVVAVAVLAILGGIAWALRPHLTVDGPKQVLLNAGQEIPISVRIDHDPFAGSIRLTAVDPPPGVTVRPGPSAGTADVEQLIVAADLNADVGPRRLTLRAIAGSRQQTATITLWIMPPLVDLPPSCHRLPGSKLVRCDGKNLPDRIECTAPDGTPVAFRLIPKRRKEDPAAFYMMENKVWNKLFAAFVAARPAAVPGWKDRAVPGDLLPVMDVTAREAHEFAVWLGGLLPTCEQWDKAAGLYDSAGRQGPFVGTWEVGSDPSRIAVNREEVDGRPLPVGQATDDISPFGCRDMAGNGLEWTRNSTDPGNMIPRLDPDALNLIFTRGRRYTQRTPLLYAELEDKTRGEILYYLRSDPEIGFRVVIEP